MHQSNFQRVDSCVNLLVITHEIFSNFFYNYKVKGGFLDISKAPD